ncbi:MAG: hypothetical protein JW910_02655, partial [Anaerolineae bacterium]|nr:hypothetical protein [Anaerolineae bacterium]
EHIVALRPDLVFMNREINRQEDAEQLAASGLTLWDTHAATVQETINALWEIMNVFDAPSMVERVRWIERQYDWTAAAARAACPLRIFMPIWYNPWVTFNAQTYTHDLLRVCGAANVFGEREQQPADSVPGEDDPRLSGQDPRFVHVTRDDIIAAQPQVILLPDAPFLFEAPHADELAALDIPAAHTGHIYLVDGSLLTWQGTRLARALHEIPPVLADVINEEG